jgi:predicted GIY-YIG superfamily endonuclease
MGSVSLRKRIIYGCLFEETNHIYIGLTSTFKKRIDEHHYRGNSAVYQYIKKTNLKPKILKLTKFISEDDAPKQEIYFMEKYKNDGYTLLNRCKGGNLGGGSGNLKWTKEKVLNLCKNYESIIGFKKENRGAYQTACRLGYLNEVSEIIGYNKSPKNYWSFEKCIKGILERCNYSDHRIKTFEGGYHNIRNIYKVSNFTNDYFKTKRIVLNNTYRNKFGFVKCSLIEYIIDNGCHTSSEILYELIMNKSSKKEIKGRLKSNDQLTENIYKIIKTLYDMKLENIDYLNDSIYHTQ